MNSRLPLGKRTFAAAAILFSAPVLFWIFRTVQGASAGLRQAHREVTNETHYAWERIRLDRAIPSSFEPIASPAQFSDAVFYEGRLYLCGPGGLLALDPDGKPAAEYHVGRELPPAPLVRLAVGLGTLGVGPQLWIATHGAGLLVFDGHAFEQVRAESAAARELTSVLPLASGRILLGTEKTGVLVWDGRTLFPLHSSLSAMHVTSLAGSETDLWIGTLDQGLAHWHAGQLERVTDAGGLPDARVLSLAVAPGGTAVFAGTALGVAEFQGGRLARTLARGTFANSLLVRNETLAIGTFEEGAIEIPLKVQQPKLRTQREAAALPPIERLLESDGRLLALAEDGLYEKNRRLFEIPGALLADRNISALSVDRAGRLWVGYFDRGLDVVEPGLDRKRHFRDEHLFCVNRIMHENNRGLTAVATANGLVVFDASAQPVRVLTKSDGLIANNVTDVLLRPDGREVAMTLATPAGLTMLESKGVSTLYAFHGLVNNHVYTLAASGSMLMAGTLGGISVLDSGVVRTNYTTANSGLKQNWITAIAPVADEWFIGTYGAGVVKLDAAGRWSSFPDLRGQIDINANAMAVTPAAVYAGTLGRGLAVYGRDSGRWSFVTNGLPSENVTALAASGGYLYIGTENGLVRIPEQRMPRQ